MADTSRPPHPLTTQVIATVDALAALLGEPTPLVRAKVATALCAETRRFVEASPFLCLATSDAQGRCDASPRGDPRGFVRILDDTRVLVPERPGNRLADSLRNILDNPQAGLLFFIPGVDDTLRVNGRATLITDESLLAPSTVEGKVPRLGILIDIEAVYTQCAKAFLRSQLWDPSRFIARSALPTNGTILKALHGESFDADGYDRERAARYSRREGFY